MTSETVDVLRKDRYFPYYRCPIGRAMPASGPSPSRDRARRKLASVGLRFLDDEVGAALGDLAAHLTAVRDLGFGVASGNLLGHNALPSDSLSLIEAVATRLARRLPPPSEFLFGKVVQETLFSLAGLDYDLDDLDPDRGSRLYFDDNDVSSLLWTVLDLYVSDAVWIVTDGDLWVPRADRESTENRRARTDALGRKAVRSVRLELDGGADLIVRLGNPTGARSLIARLRRILVEIDLRDPVIFPY